MTNARHDAPHLTPAAEQLALALPLAPVTRRPRTTPTSVVRQLPPQLLLDARTRQVGRAGIAEMRRILAGGATPEPATRAA